MSDLKIYDCFTFYNEFELLELRLKNLWNIVDCFVIVEADRTFTNKPKDFNLIKRQNDFREFAPKIRYLPVDLSKVPFKGTGDWSIEYAQRDAIMFGLNDATADDFVMIGDLDEIPAPDIFQRLRDNQVTLIDPAVIPVTLAEKGVTCPAQLLVPAINYLEVGAIVMKQETCWYYFDSVNVVPWHGTVLTKRKNLTTPQKLRNLRNRLPRAVGGGYHFSNMGGVDRVIEKMTSTVDANEFVVKSGGKFIDRKHVEEALATGNDLYERNVRPPFQYFDAHKIKLPYLDEFLRKYPYFLREPEKYFGT